MSEKIIVITGASGGIGAALAKQLAKRGERLALAARREPELKAVAKECGPGTLAVVADVSKRADAERLRDETLKAFGRIDVWINNAGQGISRSVLELTDEDFDYMMTVNVKSALYGMQAVVPYFKERQAGHVINVSSFLSRVPFAPFRSAYSAAKSALNTLTANLRMDLRAAYPNIYVSLAMPGIVATEFAKNALHHQPASGFQPQGQTADEAAAAIMDLIDRPRAEIYTNPAVQQEQAIQCFTDVAAFEANLRR